MLEKAMLDDVEKDGEFLLLADGRRLAVSNDEDATVASIWMPPVCLTLRKGKHGTLSVTNDDTGETISAACMGLSLSSLSAGAYLFSSSVSLFDLAPVSSSRPTNRRRCRAQGRSRLAAAPTLPQAPSSPGHTLTAPSTTAHSVWSG